MPNYIHALLAPALWAIVATGYGQEVVFSQRVLSPGETRIERTNSALQKKVTAVQGDQRQTVDEETRETKIKRETILEANERAVTKLKVHYEKMTIQFANEKVREVPVSGKTYLVEMREKELLITDASGDPPSKNELDLLRKEYRRFGAVDELQQIFGNRKMKIGEKVDVPREITKLIEDPESATRIESLAFVLTGTRDEGGRRVAALETSMILQANTGRGAIVSTSLKGETLLFVDTCWPLMMRIQGPLEVRSIRPARDESTALETRGSTITEIQTEYRGIEAVGSCEEVEAKEVSRAREAGAGS